VRASAGCDSHINAYFGALILSQMVCEDEYAQWKLFDPVDLVQITTILGYLPLDSDTDSVTDSVNDLVYLMYI